MLKWDEEMMCSVCMCGMGRCVCMEDRAKDYGKFSLSGHVYRDGKDEGCFFFVYVGWNDVYVWRIERKSMGRIDQKSKGSSLYI